jgi:hypothetical protein
MSLWIAPWVAAADASKSGLQSEQGGTAGLAIQLSIVVVGGNLVATVLDNATHGAPSIVTRLPCSMAPAGDKAARPPIAAIKSRYTAPGHP